MRAELDNLNHCAVPFLSRADPNSCWYYISNQSQLEAEISELRKRKMKLDEDVSQKKRQFEVLVYSIQQLQHDLHMQQATAQADKETEEMDTS